MLQYFRHQKTGLARILHEKRVFPLHAIITSCGYSKITEDYSHHGLKRGNRPVAILQYTLRGEGRLRYENKVHPLESNDLMMVRIPHDHHYWFPEHFRKPWEFFFLCLTGQEVIRTIDWLISINGPVIHFESETHATKTMLETYRACRSGTLDTAFKQSEAAYSLLMALCEELKPEADRNLPAEIQRVIKYVDHHFSEAIDIDQMADIAGLSRYHFSRRFRAHLSVSPRQYLEQQRLKDSCNYLLEPKLSIQEISERCGFNDPNYYAKVFKKAFGLTPREFRKRGF